MEAVCAPPARMCRHCGIRQANRPRRLCWTDYYTPGVKDLYPSTSRYARRGVGNFAGRAAPCEPTDALPGTPEKVAVLEMRAALGQEMHHPLDAVREDAPGDWLPPEVVLPEDVFDWS